MFGELALLSKNKRAATIKCLTDCHLATLDKRSFEIIKSKHEDIIGKKLEKITQIPFFSKIKRAALMSHSWNFKETSFIRN